MLFNEFLLWKQQMSRIISLQQEPAASECPISCSRVCDRVLGEKNIPSFKQT